MERENYNSNFLGFLRDILGYVDVTEGPPHDEMVRLVTEKWPYKMFLTPRGSLKSSIITIGYPLWRLGQDFNLRILLDSKKLERAEMYLDEIKFHIEKNAKFREVYGNWKTIPGWQEGSITVPFRTVPHKEPSINTGGVDSPQTGGHYDIIIADDLHDEKNVATDVAREKVKLHFRTLFPLMAPPQENPNSELIVVGTRWHKDDTYGMILGTHGVIRL